MFSKKILCMTLEGIGLKEAKNFLVDLKSCCSFGDLKEYFIGNGDFKEIVYQKPSELGLTFNRA